MAYIAKIAGMTTLAVMGLEGVQGVKVVHGVKRGPRVKMVRGFNRSRGSRGSRKSYQKSLMDILFNFFLFLHSNVLSDILLISNGLVYLHHPQFTIEHALCIDTLF